MTPEQLSFDLPARPALGRADFMVSPGNALAVAMIEGWQSWPGARCALIGPKGAGKTHLTRVWASLAGAEVLAAAALTEEDVPCLAAAPVAIEDVPEIAGTSVQAALFHLTNLCAAQGTPLLLSGGPEPVHWGLTLPDLASRVAALPVAALGDPDDALLAGVLAKLFADRQLTPRADVIPYLVAHMERSFVAAGEIVAALDAAALAQKRAITRPLAAALLEQRGLDPT
ncbi:MAG: chromosomal replication initiator DnaA [Pseudomonadota bacterium]